MNECCRLGFMYDGARHDDDCRGRFGVRLTDEDFAFAVENADELLEAWEARKAAKDRSVG